MLIDILVSLRANFAREVDFRRRKPFAFEFVCPTKKFKGGKVDSGKHSVVKEDIAWQDAYVSNMIYFGRKRKGSFTRPLVTF